LVKSTDCGVPSIGVTRVGLLANTNAPDPVGSDIMPYNCADVVEANTPKLFLV